MTLFAFSLMCPDARADFLCTFPLIHQSSAFLSCAGLPSQDTSSIWERGNPVDLMVVNHCRMRGVNQNNLIVMVHAVFSHPVGVQNLHVWEMSSGSFLSYPLRILRRGQLLRSPCRGFSPPLYLMAVQPTMSHACPDDDIALFRLIPKRSCTVHP